MVVNEHDLDRTAKAIADAIFAAPVGWGNDRVQRIAFRGGSDKRETDMGGYCHAALVSCIRDALKAQMRSAAGSRR